MHRSLLRLSNLRRTVPIDRLCIPVSPTYSIDTFLPAPIQLSRATLTKLHLLSALNPPTTESEWEKLKSLNDLVGIIEGVVRVDTSSIIAVKGKLVDGRVRAEAREVAPTQQESQGKEEIIDGETLLELAELREGDYFIARTPVGIRGKKRAVEKEFN